MRNATGDICDGVELLGRFALAKAGAGLAGNVIGSLPRFGFSGPTARAGEDKADIFTWC